MTTSNSIFRDLVLCLENAEAKYLIVGAHALGIYTSPRNTSDIDFFVEPTSENGEKLLRALNAFGLGGIDLAAADFTNPEIVIQFGVPPNRVDFLSGIDGVEFDAAWNERVRHPIADVEGNFISKDLLIQNKLAAGRPKDLLDVRRLRQEPLI
ncbi:hypothetical protein BH09SUM1_BH09SUM1_21380 [soil metagenome]